MNKSRFRCESLLKSLFFFSHVATRCVSGELVCRQWRPPAGPKAERAHTEEPEFQSVDKFLPIRCSPLKRFYTPRPVRPQTAAPESGRRLEEPVFGAGHAYAVGPADAHRHPRRRLQSRRCAVESSSHHLPAEPLCSEPAPSSQ